jgi:hypothetical protein
MGNTESSSPFSQVDALKYQLTSLEQKLSSLEQTHQRGHVWPNQGGSGSDLFICGAHLRCRRETTVLTGPVIGKVTGDTAHVLLEVNNAARVTCFVCLADDNCPQGRVICQETLTMPPRRPKVFVMKNLVSNGKPLVFVCLIMVSLNRKSGTWRKVPRLFRWNPSGRCPGESGAIYYT